MTILDRYIFKELVKVFILILFVLTGVLFLEKINFLSDMILNNGVPVKEVLLLLAYISPAFFTVTIPMSVMLASIMVFSSLSAENEVTAMRCCGLSVYRLMVPVMLLAFLGYCGTSFLMLNLQHKGNFLFKKSIFKILQAKTDINLKERIFNNISDRMMMYVDSKKLGTSILNGVLISEGVEGETPRVINARKGTFVKPRESSNESMKIILHLEDGAIHNLGKDKEGYRLIKFQDYDLQLDFGKLNPTESDVDKERREMSISELKQEIRSLQKQNKDFSSIEVEIYSKYALPFACFVLALVGAPLGIRVSRSGKGGGFGVGIIALLVNYLLLMAGQSIGQTGALPPILAMWLPNVIMLIVGLFILKKTARELQPFIMTILIQDLTSWLVKRIKNKQLQ